MRRRFWLAALLGFVVGGCASDGSLGVPAAHQDLMARCDALQPEQDPAVQLGRKLEAPAHRLVQPLLGSWAEYEISGGREVLLGTLRVEPVAGGCALSQRFESADSTDGGQTWQVVGKTPTRRLSPETRGAGTTLASSPRVMTFEEYSRVRHIAPYVLDISAAGGRLVYIGSRHTNDPDALDVRLIEEVWGHLRPDLAFNEGGNPPTLSERDEAVRLHGEPGLVRHLAARDGVPVASLDPTTAELVAELRDDFSLEELKLFFTLLQVKHHRNNPVEPFEVMIERVFRVLGSVPGLEGAPASVPELAAAYAERFPEQGSFRQVPDAWFNPVREGTFLNDIARRSSIRRDTFMVELLTRRTLEGKRVFAVVGASHVVMQEALIRRLLADAVRTQLECRLAGD